MRRAGDRPRARALRVLQEVTGTEDLSASAPARCFLDLHCHTSASFDSLSRPEAVVRAAAARGLTHLAITDHERIDGALAAHKAAPADLTVIVGEEIRTREGDMIGLFLESAVPAGLSAAETAYRIRDQGGLVGLPHPFDGLRASTARLAADAELDDLLALADYVEVFNARAIGRGNQRAAEIAAGRQLNGVAVSDAHTVLEVGVSYTVAEGPIGSADELRAALAACSLIMSRGSYFARASTPFAKLVQRWRGNPRQPGETATATASTPTSPNGQ